MMPRHTNNPDPRGPRQKARILAAIADGPLTAQQLADRLHLTRDGINLHLKAMKEASPRLVHVAFWLYNAKGGRPAPQYSPGDQPDATFEPSRTPTRHKQVNLQKDRIVRLLCAQKKTVLQLAADMDLSHQWVRTLLGQLRQAGRVYIGAWQRQSAGIAPLYAVGSKRDVKRPAIKPGHAYRLLQARIKRDPDALERYQKTQERRRMKEHIEKLKAKPQSWCAALM